MDLRDIDVRSLASSAGLSGAELLGLATLLAGGLLAAVLAMWPRLAPVDEVPAARVALAPSTVTVHVAGEVQVPGLVDLPAHARVADAIGAAGGATPDAELDALNLARPVTDGERILVPAATVAGPGTAGVVALRADGTLDLNLASEGELEELPGIGPVLAQRIIAWRESSGPFTAVAQLREVTGIGERLFQQLAPLVAV